MVRYILILCLLIHSTSTIAQNNTASVDSLKKELKGAKSSEKFEILSKIFEAYIFTDLDSAGTYKNKLLFEGKQNKELKIKSFDHASKYHYYKYDLDSSLYYQEKTLLLSIKENNLKLEADSYRRIAILYSRKADYTNAEKYGKLALKHSKIIGDWNLIASANTMLGNQYLKKNNYDIALEYYLSADSIYLVNNEKGRSLALVYDNIATIYSDFKDKRALEYIEKSKIIYVAQNDEEGLNYSHLMKGIYYQRIEDYHNAIENLEKANKFYEKYNSTFRKNEVYTRLINSYAAIGNFKEAEKFLLKSELLNKDTGSDENLLNFNLEAGQLYLDLKNYRKAITYLEKANNNIKEDDTDFTLSYIREINKGLSEAYLQLDDYDNAYKYKRAQLTNTDSIYNKRNVALTKNLETKYQTEKKEQEIVLLKSQNELAEQQKKSQRNIFLGGISLTSIAGLFLFVLYRNRKKTNTKLREIDALKTNFFTNISHEFRTPLTLISVPIQASLEAPGLTKQKRKHLEIANKNIQRLSSLIDQLLELSKIDSGIRKLIIQKNTPTQMIAAWSESFSYLAEQKKIDFKIRISEKEQQAWFEKEALETIVVNLIGNAIKYTPNEGEITLDVALQNKNLRIAIGNSGDGLTNSQMKTIFNRFYQTDGQNDGVGVGLSLVKELVELHGGKINVTSELHKWTIFEVFLIVDKTKLKNAEIKKTADALPIRKILDPEINELQIEETLKDTELPILLIVEDNADVRILLTDTFKKEYEVVQAINGEEGILKALEIIPDIIISDIMMPIKDGIALTNTLKNDERTSHIPIILLTAKAGDENELAGIDVGVDDYITKPFNQKILKSKTASLVALRKKLQSRYSQEVILRPKDIAITSIDEKFLERVQKILDERLAESTFSIEQFSTAVHMSRMQLHRKLKALTGLSASEFIRSQRLKLAVEILKTTDINISEVGYSVGFNDHAYFSKCFKDVYNCTPSDFADAKKSI